MGTNYYVRTPPCPLAVLRGSTGCQIHLGQSAAGWRFLHRAYPDGTLGQGFPVVDRASWLRLLDLGTIYDEYDHPVDRQVLLSKIEMKQLDQSRLGHGDPDIFDVDGFEFSRSDFS